MSEKPKFTPGPWRVATTGDKAYHATDMSVVKDVERDNDHQYDIVGICSTGGEWHCDYFEKVANAHLIAAAPEMFTALMEVLNWYNAFTPHATGRMFVPDDMIENVLKAIQKARGEQ